eukprot:431738_1
MLTILTFVLFTIIICLSEDNTNHNNVHLSRDELIALWNLHLEYEFGPNKNSIDTMNTMVDKRGYVNHIPTSIGGLGKQLLSKFYNESFIAEVPDDMEIEQISRTVDDVNQRIVDELICKFTHKNHIGWILPNIQPTNKHISIPLVAIVNFRNGKIAHEHIYWDQASVLKQIELINDDSLPIIGVAQANKVKDPWSEPSNELLNNYKQDL